jgi:RNA polymerase nonessential primary-like sigma factor
MAAPQKRLRGSCDAIATHLRNVARIPLLRQEEEISLAREVQALRRLQDCEQELCLRAGGEAPSEQAIAAEAGLSLVDLRRQRRRGERARERMVTANLRLVLSIARRYAHRELELADLVQEGNLGLMRAVDRFDPSRGYRFSTYAFWWIREAIGRALVNQGRTIRLPEAVNERLGRLRRAQHAFLQAHGRPPTAVELAQETGQKPLDVEELLFRAQQPLSLQMTFAEEDGARLEDLLACQRTAPQQQVDRHCLESDVAGLLADLPELQSQFLRLRYGIGSDAPQSLSAVARSLGITRDRARSLERRAMDAVRLRSQRVFDHLAS